MKRSVAAALVTLALFGSPAFGDTQFVTDIDDVEGKLDIGQLRFAHDGKKYEFTINFYDKWKVKTLKAGNGGLNIYMDTIGAAGSGFNYYATVVKTGSGLDCILYRANGNQAGNGKAHKDGKAVTCTIPKKKVFRDRALFEWSINSNWKTGNGDFKHDYAPNDGYYTHIISQDEG